VGQASSSTGTGDISSGVAAQLARRLSASCDEEFGSTVSANEDLSGVGGELHDLIGHGDVAHDRVVEGLVSCAVEPDVVCGPADAELLAAG